MCVVFAGPFPAGFSLKEVRRLFRCCGLVHNIRMLNTAVRVCLTFSMIHLTPVNQWETGGKGKRLQLGSFLIAFALQVHAEIEFELLEGAELALKTLNGLNVQGQAIKVTPPIVFCSFRSG